MEYSPLSAWATNRIRSFMGSVSLPTLDAPAIVTEMDRRRFIAWPCAFLGRPLTVEAQPRQERKDWRLGILSPYTLDDPWSKELTQALGDAGYVDGRNGKIEWRSA